MSNLYIKFMDGLRGVGLDPYDVQKNYRYAGGNTPGPDLNRFRLECPGEPIPEFAGECICGHKITKNCYIHNKDTIIIVGSCCVKRFMPTGTKRLCITCGLEHKNRTVNKCNHCRGCLKCGATPDPGYRYCRRCAFD